MRAAISPPAQAWRGPPPFLLAAIAVATLLVALVFATPLNHDEDQYQAASVLAASARLYADFLYVQTPLFPELTAPLTRLTPGWSFLALRLVSAVCGLAALGGVWAAQRRLGVGRRTAIACALLMAACYTFQYCSSVVRNDAMPMVLLAWAIAAAAGALRDDARRPRLDWGLCGLLLGLAVSAKVSFAPLLAAAAPFAVGRGRARGTIGFGIGAAAGLFPIVAAWAGSPEAVRFALIGFWADGPRRWYVANGLTSSLGPASKLAHGLEDLALGPALAALAVVAFSRLRRHRAPSEPSLAPGFLDLMVLAGLVAAFAPAPTYKQYFAPLLAPLFVRLGLSLSAPRRPAWTTIALGLGVAAGLTVFALKVGQAAWTAAHGRRRRWRARPAGSATPCVAPGPAVPSPPPVRPRRARQRLPAGPPLRRRSDDLSQRRRPRPRPAPQAAPHRA